MKKGIDRKLWTILFGIKIGDKIHLKYGKVIWKVYAEGDYVGTEGKWKGRHHYWKLRRRTRGWFSETVYKTIWDWDLKAKGVEIVGKT